MIQTVKLELMNTSQIPEEAVQAAMAVGGKAEWFTRKILEAAAPHLLAQSMDTRCMTIIEFLEARIAEDEEQARGATGAHWHGQACEVRTYPEGEPQSSAPRWFQVAAMHHPNHFSDALHIARHDPARVLAECAAKRAVIKAALNADTYGDQISVLIAVASTYASHPDYQQEWALDG